MRASADQVQRARRRQEGVEGLGHLAAAGAQDALPPPATGMAGFSPPEVRGDRPATAAVETFAAPVALATIANGPVPGFHALGHASPLSPPGPCLAVALRQATPRLSRSDGAPGTPRAPIGYSRSPGCRQGGRPAGRRARRPFRADSRGARRNALKRNGKKTPVGILQRDWPAGATGGIETTERNRLIYKDGKLDSTRGIPYHTGGKRHPPCSHRCRRCRVDSSRPIPGSGRVLLPHQKRGASVPRFFLRTRRGPDGNPSRRRHLVFSSA
jgi:hypothetical protein